MLHDTYHGVTHATRYVSRCHLGTYLIVASGGGECEGGDSPCEGADDI